MYTPHKARASRTHAATALEDRHASLAHRRLVEDMPDKEEREHEVAKRRRGDGRRRGAEENLPAPIAIQIVGEQVLVQNADVRGLLEGSEHQAANPGAIREGDADRRL